MPLLVNLTLVALVGFDLLLEDKIIQHGLIVDLCVALSIANRISHGGSRLHTDSELEIDEIQGQ